MSTQNEYILDTNILIRFLTHDIDSQTKAVEKLFTKARTKSLIIPDIIVVEIVHVLLSVYKIDKKAIIDKINILLTFEKFKINTSLFQKVVELYSRHTISFVDAYLVALTSYDKPLTLYTFDKKLLTLLNINTKQP